MWFTAFSLALFALSLGRMAIHQDVGFPQKSQKQTVLEKDETYWKDLQRRFRAKETGACDEFIAGGVEAVPWLVELLRDSSAGASRFLAANALGELGVSECVEPLLRALHDDWFNVRRCAAIALGTIGDPRARRPLERLAKTDPYRWADPDTQQVTYLVRIDAARALVMLEEGREIFLDDASKPPPFALAWSNKPCRWPFPGGFRQQNLYNNYQQPTDAYVHAALDLLQAAGTEVLAVEDGTVAVIATNYPNWTTHHFFIVEPERGAGEGWCYTHVDPASYTFEVGGKVRAGQVLGRVVDFSLGKRDGVDHLHLHYVAFDQQATGEVELRSLYDPLLRFDWKDGRKPTIHTPFNFVRDLPRNPVVYLLKVTNTDGDGIIEPTDKRHTWDTGQLLENGQRLFPDGAYMVVVRAWDLAGNRAEASMRVTIAND